MAETDPSCKVRRRDVSALPDDDTRVPDRASGARDARVGGVRTPTVYRRHVPWPGRVSSPSQSSSGTDFRSHIGPSQPSPRPGPPVRVRQRVRPRLHAAVRRKQTDTQHLTDGWWDLRSRTTTLVPKSDVPLTPHGFPVTRFTVNTVRPGHMGQR